MPSSSSSWESCVGEHWAARLASANRPIRALVVIAAIAVLGTFAIPLLGLSAWIPEWLGWAGAVVALAIAYASPVALLNRVRLQDSIRDALEGAGLSFAGRPAVGSPAAFLRWLDRNGLDHAEVRSVLGA